MGSLICGNIIERGVFMAENNEYGNSNIFRQKSLDRVSSVEDLDKYIKTTTPSLWLLLASIIILLVGVIVWAVVGKINVETVSACSVTSGKITCFVNEDRVESINEDSFIEINDTVIKINKVNGPIEANEQSDKAALHTSNIQIGTWYYEVIGACNLSDGNYKGKVVFEEVSPITYVIN